MQPEQRTRNCLVGTQEELGRETPQSVQNPHAPEDLGETQEELSPESPHSAQNLHVPEAQAPGIPQHQQRVKWPPASKGSEWQKFDDDVDGILEATMKGAADRKLQTMTTMIISFASERFGSVEKHAATNQYSKNRRAEKIAQLRQELRLLKRQFRGATEDMKPGLAELRGILRKKLLTLRRAEWHRRRAKERARR